MTVDDLIAEVDNRIASLMPQVEETTPFYGMLSYHLGWVDEQLRPATAAAGKRVRARLCLLACEAVGAPPARAVPAAAAVELIHNFSLIHDDIQDRSEYRRHRRTVWAVWGEAQAINAGDDMFVLAQLALLNDESTDPSITVRGARALNQACRTLCEGQYLDLDFERRATISSSDYYAMIERKTAALLESSCHLGALYGGADKASIEALSEFGKQLGIAFQMQDDYLGIWGDPKETGKPAADDVASKKKTLPLLFALQMATTEDRSVLDSIFARPGLATSSEVDQVLGILDRCGAADHTAAEAARHTALALEALTSLRQETSAALELASICRKLAGRAN
jgi:geranylgeranyl diphosphate synthase, type I